jgi:E3 ubiquitin-protein ligase UBR4
MLTSDLDGEEEKDRACLESLLTEIINDLCMKQPDTNNICDRNEEREVHLVFMRLLSEYLSQEVHCVYWIEKEMSITE